AARFRIGYAPEGWQGLKQAFPDYDHQSLVDAGLVIANEGKRYDRFRDRIMFPILNARGAVIGFGGRVLGDGEPKYLNSPETPLFAKGSEVYGLVQARDAMRAAGRVLVVEGYMDVVALAQFGVGYSVATLGTATTPAHVSKLLRLTDELVFSFDGDKAGRKAAWRALEVSLPLANDSKPIRFLFLPEEDDPDSYIRKNGKEAFEQLVRAAPTLSEFLIAELRSEHDLNTPEGRAGFLVASKAHLEKLTAPMLRMQLLREFASLARVSSEDIERLIRPDSTPVHRNPARPKEPSKIVVPPEKNLLRYVLAYPKLVGELEIGLLDPNLPETGFLQIIAGRQIDDNTSAAVLLEFFQGPDFDSMASEAQMAAEEQKFSSEMVAHDFKKLHLALQIKHKNDEIEALKSRVNADPRLSPELNQRIQELVQLKSQRIAPSA
ncbi:MAG: DNA primase, partial [Methyloceanibacter sp.]|nr:DNA primase [Methyloceanibacter sp.]